MESFSRCQMVRRLPWVLMQLIYVEHPISLYQVCDVDDRASRSGEENVPYDAAAVDSPVHVVVAHGRSGRDTLVEASGDLVLFTIVAPFQHDSTPCDQWECDDQDDEHNDPFLQKMSVLRIHSPVHEWSNCDPHLQDHLHRDLEDRSQHF